MEQEVKIVALKKEVNYILLIVKILNHILVSWAFRMVCAANFHNHQIHTH